MDDNYLHVYQSQADRYHAMIAREDADGALLPVISAAFPANTVRLVDVGSGTGRIPLLLRGKVPQVVAIDLHAAMLHEQRQQIQPLADNLDLLQGDYHALPLASQTFDMLTAGWALGHLQAWYEDWQMRVDIAVTEMLRVVRPGGVVLIMETLGTGTEQANPPHERLAAYYAHLEQNWGFTRQVVQTDFQFNSVEEAIENTEFFFGVEMSARIRSANWTRIPEWTGVWQRKAI